MIPPTRADKIRDWRRISHARIAKLSGEALGFGGWMKIRIDSHPESEFVERSNRRSGLPNISIPRESVAVLPKPLPGTGVGVSKRAHAIGTERNNRLVVVMLQ
jgi:hypothetical protein